MGRPGIRNGRVGEKAGRRNKREGGERKEGREGERKINEKETRRE